jgi:PRA1 family protein
MKLKSIQLTTFPATTSLLPQENAAFYCTNYLRCLLFILMLTLYLRPIAVVGALVLAITISFNLNTALELQQRRLDAAAGAAAAAAAPTAPQSPLGAVLAVAAWLAVMYTRCMPIIILGLSIGMLICLLHASLHTSPSELRLRRGNVNHAAATSSNPITHHFYRLNRFAAASAAAPHSYTLGQVLGRQPSPPGCDPRLVFKQLHRTFIEFIIAMAVLGKRWLVYYVLIAWDTVRRPFVPALRSAPNTWT